MLKTIGDGHPAPARHVPFAPRAKKVLELSLREALQLGHDCIGTEDLLLGLVRVGDGVAAQVLSTFGADIDRVRQQVVRFWSIETDEPEREQAPRGATPSSGPPDRAPATAVSPLTQLSQYQQMLYSGLITQADYDAAKAKVLGL